MRRSWRRAAFGLIVPAAMVLMAATPLNLGVSSESRLWVEGGSTVRSWKCSAKTLDTDMTSAAVVAGQAIRQLEASVSAVDLKVPVAQMDCGNGKMNEHMLKALKAPANPTIRFTLASHTVTEQADGTGAVQMQGKLTIGGTTRPVTLQAKATELGGGAVKVTGRYELKMSDFGVKAPTLMMGTLKVADAVTVAYDLVLK